MAPAQLPAEGHGIALHHQIQIRCGAQPIEQGIAHGASHQRRFPGKGFRWQRPALGLQPLPGQLRRLCRVHNGPIRCGAGHVHLRGLPLGGSMSGLPRG